MAKHNEIGKIGENITKSFLMKHGYVVKSTNESIRYGEIDIVAEKSNSLHFVEVKSVSVDDINKISDLVIKPEDNFTIQKRQKLKRTINLYLSNKKNHFNIVKACVDLACVYINPEKREGRVKFIENVEI